MTDLVNPDQIEELVGTKRHPTEHYGSALDTRQTVYILHSHECKNSGRDLRQCPYSVALDKGIRDVYPWTAWRRVTNRPVRLQIARGYLMPDFKTYRQALADAKGPKVDPGTAPAALKDSERGAGDPGFLLTFLMVIGLVSFGTGVVVLVDTVIL